uniref:hydroxyisourate hydrolase n=1 Tax=Gallus gallus TaxID=9031 RepID=A0A8V0XY10_CHICK
GSGPFPVAQGGAGLHHAGTHILAQYRRQAGRTSTARPGRDPRGSALLWHPNIHPGSGPPSLGLQCCQSVGAVEAPGSTAQRGVACAGRPSWGGACGDSGTQPGSSVGRAAGAGHGLLSGGTGRGELAEHDGGEAGSSQARDAERVPDHPCAEHSHRAARCRPRSAPGKTGGARGTVDGAGAQVGESAASRQRRLLPTSPMETSGASPILLPSAFRWTDADGRCLPLLPPGQAEAGTYKLHFETAAYWQGLGHTSFYPFVEVVFTITDPAQKLHVPLLISPYSYTTYRGS